MQRFLISMASDKVCRTAVLAGALFSTAPVWAEVDGFPDAPVEVSAAELNKQTYVFHAISQENAYLDALAGVVYFTLLDHPELTAEEAALLIEDAWALISVNSPAPDLDISHSTTAALSNIIHRLVDAGADGELGMGVHAFGADYVSRHFANQDLYRRLATWEFNLDDVSSQESYRERLWEQLYQLAYSDSDVRSAIDQSVFTSELISGISDSTHTILADNPEHPLNTFLSGKIAPDGSLTLYENELESVLIDQNNLLAQLKTGYMGLLKDLDEAQQAAVTGMLPQSISSSLQDESAETPEEPPSPLEQAVADAKQQLEQLKPQKSMHENVTKTLTFISKAIKYSGVDGDLAKNIGRAAKAYSQTLGSFDKFTKDAIKTGEKITGFLGGGAQTFETVSAIVFTGNIVGAFVGAIKLFKDSPNPDKLILQGLKEVRDLITEVREEFRHRFDRIDSNLNVIYTAMLAQFDAINWDLGQISDDVQEIQRQLYKLQADLNRIERNIYEFLQVEGRRDFVENVDLYLNYFGRTGVPLAFIPGYDNAESQFHVWATRHASDALQAGPAIRDYDDDSLIQELTSYPLAYNINYLSQLPVEKFGLPALNPLRLSNPVDWMASANAYAQLAEESPEHHVRIAPRRIEEIYDEGISLRTGLANIADHALFEQIVNNYSTKVDALNHSIATLEDAYIYHTYEKTDAVKSELKDFDLWGDAAQLTIKAKNALRTKFRTASYCTSSSAAVNLSRGIMDSFFRNTRMRPFFLADYLDINDVTFCGSSQWLSITEDKIDDYPFNYWLITAKPFFKVYMKYKGENVVSYSLTSSRPVVIWGAQLPQCTSSSPCALPSAYGFADKADFSTERFAYYGREAAFRAEAEHDIADFFEAEQKLLYEHVFEAIKEGAVSTQRDDALKLSGAREMIKAYAALGLPVSTASDELLRALLYGPGSTSLPDHQTIADIYSYYASINVDQNDLPVRNIKEDIVQLADDRATEIGDLFGQIIDRIDASGEAETDRLLLPTLTRLNLLRDTNVDYLTVAGSDVLLTAPGVSVQFEQIVSPGTTSITPVPAGDAGSLPADYELYSNTGYKVTSDAVYKQSMDICFSVAQLEDPYQFAALRVFQNDGSGLMDVTVDAPDSSQPDYLARRICGRSDVLGTFVLVLDVLDSDGDGVSDIVEDCKEGDDIEQCALLSTL